MKPFPHACDILSELYFIRTSYVSESYPIMLCVWDYEPTAAPPGQSLCLHWKHTQKSVLIPDRTHLWIHPACFTCSAHLTLCEYRVFSVQTRSLLSVFEEDAGTLTNYTNQLLQSMQRVFGAQVHTRVHIDLGNRNLLYLNKYSVYWSRFISAWYFKEKS